MSEWTDNDGLALGTWVEIERDEWRQVIEDAGGLEALTVFSSLTDPAGLYGPAQIYTAWGIADQPAPLVDIRDQKTDPTRTVLRKFVLAEAPNA